MGLQQDVGNRDPVFEVRPRVGLGRVFVRADVVPRPAIERAFAHARDVVGGTSSPSPSRSLVEHHAVPLDGATASPTQLRMPVAKILSFLPSGSNAKTSARPASSPQGAPSG